jgi:hypothetical protein
MAFPGQMPNVSISSGSYAGSAHLSDLFQAQLSLHPNPNNPQYSNYPPHAHTLSQSAWPSPNQPNPHYHPHSSFGPRLPALSNSNHSNHSLGMRQEGVASDPSNAAAAQESWGSPSGEPDLHRQRSQAAPAAPAHAHSKGPPPNHPKHPNNFDHSNSPNPPLPPNQAPSSYFNPNDPRNPHAEASSAPLPDHSTSSNGIHGGTTRHVQLNQPTARGLLVGLEQRFRRVHTLHIHYEVVPLDFFQPRDVGRFFQCLVIDVCVFHVLLQSRHPVKY